jgi:hypothetical protein
MTARTGARRAGRPAPRTLVSLGASLAAALIVGGCAARSPVGFRLAGSTPTVSASVNVTAQPRPTARAIALRAAGVLLPYHDPLHTFDLRRPQTWGVLDARTSPDVAHALGDGVRFFEPISTADPDAGSSGKLWIEVLPARTGSTPRALLLKPFVDADYPAALLRRLTVIPARLGGVPGYRLVSLPAGNGRQETLLVARYRGRDYRVTVFGALVPPEVAPVLRSWRFVGAPG